MKYQLFTMLLLTLNVFAYSITPVPLQKDTIIGQSINPKLSKSVSLGFNLVNFNPTKSAKQEHMKSVILNPGVEALLHFKSNSEFIFSAGILYQRGKIQRSNPQARIIFDELCLPILFTIPISNSIDGGFSLSSGIYFGKYLNSNIENKGGKLNPHNDWFKLSKEFIDGYSNNNQIADIYFGLNFKEYDFKSNFLQISLFAKYRFIDHWVNKDVSRFLWGLKISYNFKI